MQCAALHRCQPPNSGRRIQGWHEGRANHAPAGLLCAICKSTHPIFSVGFLVDGGPASPICDESFPVDSIAADATGDSSSISFQPISGNETAGRILPGCAHDHRRHRCACRLTAQGWNCSVYLANLTARSAWFCPACSWVPRPVQAYGKIRPNTQLVPAVEWQTNSADKVIEVCRTACIERECCVCCRCRSVSQLTNSGMCHGAARVFKTADCLEVDCNIRCWSIVARRAIASMWDDVPKFDFQLGAAIHCSYHRSPSPENN